MNAETGQASSRFRDASSNHLKIYRRPANVGSKPNAAGFVPHGLIEANPRQRFGRNHCHRRRREDHVLESPDIRLYLRAGCREPARFGSFPKISEHAMGGYTRLLATGESQCGPRRSLVAAVVDQGRKAHFCRIHDRLIAQGGRRTDWNGRYVPRDWNRLGRRYKRNIDEHENCCREHQVETGLRVRGLA
ncbi:hypothetical protein ACVWW2_006548 [Bradyrhizobium sp. LM4.3]